MSQAEGILGRLVGLGADPGLSPYSRGPGVRPDPGLGPEYLSSSHCRIVLPKHVVPLLHTEL